MLSFLVFIFSLPALWSFRASLAKNDFSIVRHVRLWNTSPLTSRSLYEEVTITLSKNKLVVIDFQKSNCKPCKKAAPVFEKLSNKYQENVLFYTVDADTSKDCLDLMRFAGVKSVPTFFVFRQGERVDSIVGAHLDDLENRIKDELKNEGVDISQFA